MSFFGPPVAFALFVWWFSTGLIIVLDNLPRRTFGWSMLAMTGVAGYALNRLSFASMDVSVTGAYTAFTCGLLVWGWQEMSFLMGFVTGSRRVACDGSCSFGAHFVHGVQAVIHHELAIIAGFIAIVALSWGGPNQVATWTYGILWGMRVSAKLNLFLGVRNLNESFLPEHLRYLGSFFRVRDMNLLFPLSVTVGMIVSMVLVQRAFSPDRFTAVAYAIAATMTILGVIEHWAMILPVPFAKLWNWRPSRKTALPAVVLYDCADPAHAHAHSHTHSHLGPRRYAADPR
jgi:putative photosynthetic complex assembly protein 2